jgi:hypothetical protein
LTEKEIFSADKNDKLFGMVEVYIEVPEEWEGEFRQNESPYDYFKDFPPIFVTADVPFEQFGKVMQEHVIKFGNS